MSLYNIKTTNGEYWITKFDEDMNPESSYKVSETECSCPAGFRKSCRHREMLPIFIREDKVDTNWFFDFDLQDWESNHFGELEA